MKRLNTLIAALYGLAIWFGAFPPAPAYAEVPAQFINAQTGTTYTFTQQDCSKLVTFNNGAAVAVTLPQAGTGGFFFAGCFIDVQNKGLGTVTITPTTSTINSFTTLALTQNQNVRIVSDSTNYQIESQSSAASNASYATFRNFLDNGAMNIAQRGTAATVGGTTTTCVYVADRWCVQTNVGSGAGDGQVVATSPPTGFTQFMNLWRVSGALTQPICAIQEIKSTDSTPLAGKQVVLSFYAKALAGLNADNGNAINVSVITGTTTADQGVQTPSTTPLFTPAWTGIAATTTAFTITTGWVRYQTAPITIPAAAINVGVEMCFTPTATGAGATDGYGFTGVQLEQSSSYASSYEFHPYALEYQRALYYFYQFADAAATVRFPGMCTENVSGTSALCTWLLPVLMRSTPTVTIGTSNAFGMTKTADGTAEVCTTNVLTSTSANNGAFSSLCSVSETAAVGTAHQIIGGATTGIISASADF